MSECVCASVCVFVSVCDSSSETGNEWASSLGTAGAIFSTGLYNWTGGVVVLWKYVDDEKFERAQSKFRRYSVCKSTVESAQGRICKSRIRFVHEGRTET